MVSRPVSARRSGHCPSDRAVCGNKCAMQEKFAKGIGCGSFRFFNLILIPRIEEHLRWMREPYDSPFFLTIFRGPRRLGWGKEADGTISGT